MRRLRALSSCHLPLNYPSGAAFGSIATTPAAATRWRARQEGSAYWKSVLSRLLSNGEVDEACRLFATIPSPDVRLYTIMLTGCSRGGRIREAFRLFDAMPERDTAAWNSMIKACLDSGDLPMAERMFDKMPERNVISWTTMMNGLAQFGRVGAAEELFWRMPHRDTAAWNAMISAYCGCRRVGDAASLFGKMPQPNVISWTAMIGGFEQNGENYQALQLFRQMWVSGTRPVPSTYASVLTACAGASDLTLGIQLHGHLIKVGCLLDSFVFTSLVTLYAHCKQMEDSVKLSHHNQDRDVVSWTALVTGYGLNARHEEALYEFKKMVASEIRPNASTLTSALNSCCGLEALDVGKVIHASTIKQGQEVDVFVANSLMVLYSKCGDIEDGLVLFNIMSTRNLVSWNSIIVGCAQNGHESLALTIFDDMRAINVQPDEITYIGLLTACSHSRMLEKGRYIFHLLEHDPSVVMKLEHYACMVDMLGRCGELDEAENLILNMPMEPNVTIWLTLLSSCRVHANVEVARRTSKKIFDIEPFNSAAYVLLSNIYASAGRWNDVSQTRVMMRHRGIMKIPGASWVTLRETRHEFLCGDRSHPMSPDIYKKLDWLGCKLKEYGYIHDDRFALHDVDDEQKEATLTYHSEKLAIAFALLTTANGSTIRVMKNLRVCGDCHAAIKLISKIVGRRIVLRDTSRFHHLNDGLCSCGEVW